MPKKEKSRPAVTSNLPAALLEPARIFREQTREAFERVESAAARVEELMGRTEATFLGGSLLPVITYALLHQAREETMESIRNLGKDAERSGEPSDLVDRTDFFASALAEMAALVKIFSTMEIDVEVEGNAALREDWERLADDLQALATILQNASEEFEDALDASEPDGLVNIKLPN